MIQAKLKPPLSSSSLTNGPLVRGYWINATMQTASLRIDGTSTGGSWSPSSVKVFLAGLRVWIERTLQYPIEITTSDDARALRQICHFLLMNVDEAFRQEHTDKLTPFR